MILIRRYNLDLNVASMLLNDEPALDVKEMERVFRGDCGVDLWKPPSTYDYVIIPLVFTISWKDSKISSLQAKSCNQ